MKLANKMAIITGGARGIGRVLAESHVREGVRVFIADRAVDEAKRTARLIGGGAIAIELDVTEHASIEACLAEVGRQVAATVPSGRMGRSEDHVDCAIFLASGESGYAVARTFNVDGSQWMS